ncbi:MAG: zinc ribbon domain-containing protein [Gammaproteobacteria bacterium]|nr:zinc ribbon domain-containing protein [Gammaproteobacteria bacterium]
MPIYEYECTACGHRLEVIQKFSDAPLAECPACGKSALHKLLSAPSFHLKGSGWYQTDFKEGGKKKLAETTQTEATGEAKASDSTAGTKDAAVPAPAATAVTAPKPAAASGTDAA